MTDIEPSSIRADRIRASYERGDCDRAEAIREIRAVYDDQVTELGAADYLDHPVYPSQRRSDVTGSGKSHVHALNFPTGICLDET